MWAEHGDLERNFFLPRPLPDLSGFGRRAASAADAAWLGAHILARLRVPRRAPGRDGDWVLLGRRLLPQGFDLAWTNHSERATLVSGLAAAGIERKHRDALGRWCPKGSDQFARTYKARARDLVSHFVRIVREGHAYQTFDEEDACAEVERRLVRKGVTAATAHAETAKVKGIAKSVAGQYGDVDYAPTEVATDPALPDEEVDVDSEDTGFEAAKYIIALGKKARVHKALGCWHARTLSFREYEFIQDGDLKPEMYDTFCATCWNLEGTDADELAQDTSEEGDASSDSA